MIDSQAVSTGGLENMAGHFTPLSVRSVRKDVIHGISQRKSIVNTQRIHFSLVNTVFCCHLLLKG